MSEYRQVLPFLLQIRSIGIDIDKLLPFNLAVNKKVQTKNLSVSSAVYSVFGEIENYNRIGGLKNEISRLAAQIYAINEICAPRNKAITSLLKLQNYGITDIEILNVCEYLNRARFESRSNVSGDKDLEIETIRKHYPWSIFIAFILLLFPLCRSKFLVFLFLYYF